MASGHLTSNSGGGNGSREKKRWADSKVYTRKSFKSSSKLNPSSQPAPPPEEQDKLNPSSQPAPPPKEQDELNPSSQPASPPKEKDEKEELERATGDEGNPIPLLPVPSQVQLLNFVASDDNVAICTDVHVDEPPQEPLISCGVVKFEDNNVGTCSDVPVNEPPREPLVSYSVVNGRQQVVTINPEVGSKEEVLELRQILEKDLEKVRACCRKVEARELQLIAATVVPALPSPLTPGYSFSQLSATGDGVHPFCNGSGRKSFKTRSAGTPFYRQLSVSVTSGRRDSYGDVMEKEKRTPKANQYYKNSDFLLAKDRIPPPPPSIKRSKSDVNKKHSGGYGMPDFKKVYDKAFTRCGVLLSKLMKHKFGWVFNTPVDVESLGIHDYHDIIKHPMDLGTVKKRLSTNWYRSPREFADDVRLTFNNAMTYNPKGQDVHIIAEELLSIFEERWLSIDSEFNIPPFYKIPSKKVPPPLDIKRILERSESLTQPVVPNSMPSSLNYTPHFGRTSARRKPRAKDEHKREMTLDEKQKLARQLETLPQEKLELVVQLIQNRTSNLSQYEGGIEVDIDNLDTETLWELDRFMTNYKKNLSKRKRKAELAMLAKQERHIPDTVMIMPNENPVVEKAIEIDADKQQQVVSASPICDVKKGDDESRSSSSSSSSSDSGSSSDSDSDSSSDDNLT